MRERRAKFESQSGFVERVIYEGTLRMSQEADETVRLMKKAMGLSGLWNRISRKGRAAIKKEQKAQWTAKSDTTE